MPRTSKAICTFLRKKILQPSTGKIYSELMP